MAEIRFYRATGEYGYLSNLWMAPIVFEMRQYRCSEYAYQAAKPADDKVREWMLAAPTPALCAQLAHSLFVWQVAGDWGNVKVDRMRCVLQAKFEQHADLAAKLAETGDATLIEESKTDAFWGIGKKGTGKNTLGLLLMELRGHIQRGERPARMMEGTVNG